MFWASAPLELGDPRAGGGELVLQGDDAGGGVQVQALVEQGPHPGGDGELAARVPAVPAAGAVRGEDAGGVEAAQERRLDLEQLGRLAHGDGGVVLVVEPGDASGHAVRFLFRSVGWVRTKNGPGLVRPGPWS